MSTLNQYVPSLVHPFPPPVVPSPVLTVNTSGSAGQSFSFSFAPGAAIVALDPTNGGVPSNPLKYRTGIVTANPTNTGVISLLSSSGHVFATLSASDQFQLPADTLENLFLGLYVEGENGTDDFNCVYWN